MKTCGGAANNTAYPQSKNNEPPCAHCRWWFGGPWVWMMTDLLQRTGHQTATKRSMLISITVNVPVNMLIQVNA